MFVPSLNKRFLCIVNCDNQILAALVSSYLNSSEQYLPMFSFPSTSAFNLEVLPDIFDEDTPSKERATNFSIRIKNIINKLNYIECLFFVGLTSEQKSFLDFSHNYNCVEVNSLEDFEKLLQKNIQSYRENLKIKQTDILLGLSIASRMRLVLKIDDSADSLIPWKNNSKGLVIIEDSNLVGSVIAANYACAINATIEIISPFNEKEIREIKELIEKWKVDKRIPHEQSFSQIRGIIFDRIQHIDFKKYEYVTFFTVGIPYTLITKNCIPSSYVSLENAPDFFIFNNIYYEGRKYANATIVFSPLEFGMDEETQEIIRIFEREKIFVKRLIGSDASAYNLDMGIASFPFDLLHICSHGGEVEGYRGHECFTDQDGKKHAVEFEEVLSFMFDHREEKVKVQNIQIYKYFDGYKWNSEELKSQNYPHYVYSDMVKAMKDRIKNKYSATPIGIIKNSWHIKCYDFNYLAMIDNLSGDLISPIIFNNTCWSNNRIKDSFIDSGARCYIGTLWDIDNTIAKKSAEDFYTDLFNGTLLNAFQNCLRITIHSFDEDIYIFWGLHFSTFPRSLNSINSRNEVIGFLNLASDNWNKKFNSSKNQFIRETAERNYKWCLSEIDEILKL